MAESVKILVINQNKDSQYLPYEEQYVLFGEWKAAVSYAKKIGWEDPLGMGINKKTGIGNIFHCGDVKVTILALDES